MRLPPSERAWRRTNGSPCAPVRPAPCDRGGTLRSWRLRPAGRTGLRFGNEPRPALVGDVIPQPDEGDDETVAQADQEIDVHDAPEQPAGEARQFQPTQLHDGRTPADRRQIAEMPVTERRRRRDRKS